MEKIKRYIIAAPWDVRFEAMMGRIEKRIIIPFLALAALYFGYVCVTTLWRMP